MREAGAVEVGRVMDRRLPPGPTGRALVQSMLGYMSDPLSALSTLAGRYGDVVHFAHAPVNAFLVTHPAHVQQVLVDEDWNFVPVRPPTFSRAFHQSTASADGYFHLRHRHLFEPTVEADRIAPFGAGVVECADWLTQGWSDGATLDIESEMAKLAAAVMGDLFFGAESRADPRELEAAVIACDHLATRATNPLATFMEGVPVVPSNRRFWHAIAALDEFVYGRIRRRRETGAREDDLLGRLLAATDPAGRGMVDRQIRDELISIYMVPSILMGKAMTWTWFLLSQHPEPQAALHAEVDALGSDRDQQPPAGIAGLPFAAMLLEESMRLYPPSWVVGRIALQDFELDGYWLPAGAVAVLSAYITQRDPRFFPDPEKFDPSRWTDAARSARPEWSFYPFSAGPRNCLGRHFARLAMPLMLATIAASWEVRLVPGHNVAPEALFALRPRDGLRMSVHRRPVAPKGGR